MARLPLHLIQVHKHRDKRRLSVTGHQCDQLILDRLDPPLDLIGKSLLYNSFQFCVIGGKTKGLKFLLHFLSQLLTADVHKRSKMGQGKGLSAVLVARHLRHDLGGHITRRIKGMWLFNQSIADHRTILKHILQIDQITVMFFLCIII